MTVNLHTHTVRCGHAKGEDREYVERAIACGITHLGFSDHAPLVLPNGEQSCFRIPMERAEEYAESVRALREEYRKDIRIYLGLEMEYYPELFGQMMETVRALGVEYLICGQHYIPGEEGIPQSYTGIETESPEKLEQYVSTVLEAMDRGVFTYFAHPDLLHYVGDESFFAENMRPICRKAAEKQIPLEINLLGFRNRRHYPRESFWRVAAEEGCIAVLGSDAHSPEHTFDPASIEVAEALIAKYDIKLLEHPTLIHPLTGERTLL